MHCLVDYGAKNTRLIYSMIVGWIRCIVCAVIHQLLLSSTCHASQLIIEPEMGRAPIIREIEKADQSIQLVMYNLTDKTLLNALLEQKRNGRDVQVILEKTPYRTTTINKKTISKLKRSDIAWRGSVPEMRFIHQKTLLIDKREAMVMTFNFTHSAFKKQRNFALIIDDPIEVKEIGQHFAADWSGIRAVSRNESLIWSPDDSRQKITALINNAKNEIHVYAQSITDKGMIAALENAAHRGVKVTVISNKGLPPLNGITTITDALYYIHAKAFIIDNQTAIIGSTNLTKNSLEQNRELSVVTHDPAIIKQLQKVFASDSGWQLYR